MNLTNKRSMKLTYVSIYLFTYIVCKLRIKNTYVVLKLFIFDVRMLVNIHTVRLLRIYSIEMN